MTFVQFIFRATSHYFAVLTFFLFLLCASELKSLLRMIHSLDELNSFKNNDKFITNFQR